MSTRATLTVDDGKEKFHLYIHYDGYPAMVIPKIESALKFSWEFPRFEAWEFITALIRVMKKCWWEIYLINWADEILDKYYHYEVTEEKWDLKIKTISSGF